MISLRFWEGTIRKDKVIEELTKQDKDSLNKTVTHVYEGHLSKDKTKFTLASKITTGGDNILYEVPSAEEQIDMIHLTLKSIEERLDKLEEGRKNDS